MLLVLDTLMLSNIVSIVKLFIYLIFLGCLKNNCLLYYLVFSFYIYLFYVVMQAISFLECYYEVTKTV